MQVEIKLPDVLREAMHTIAVFGGVPMIVGGAVRDAVMQQLWGVHTENKDFDVEVFHMGFDTLFRHLSKFGKVDLVGNDFGVLKLQTEAGTFDFSLPRNDLRLGAGHKNFRIGLNPESSFEDAASRRDFTINAMLWDFKTNEVIDPFDGVIDIEFRILRPVGKSFGDDALRVLRGMQFAARFDMALSLFGRTTTLPMIGEFFDIPRERVLEEWLKWAERGIKPSTGLRFLVDAGWINPDATQEDFKDTKRHVERVRQLRKDWIREFALEMVNKSVAVDFEKLENEAKELFPFDANLVAKSGLFEELQRLINCPQDAIHHPEGWLLNFASPSESHVTGSTESVGLNLGNAGVFGQLIPSTPTFTTMSEILCSTFEAEPIVANAVESFFAASQTRDFSSLFSFEFGVTIPTKPKSLVRFFGASTFETDEVFRIMFKVSGSSMKRIVDTCGNDFEVIKAVVQPVSIFMMNMLPSLKDASKIDFHDDSMDTNGGFVGRPTSIQITSVIIDSRSLPVDNNVSVIFDFNIRDLRNHDLNPIIMKGDVTFHNYITKIGDVFTHTSIGVDIMAEDCIKAGVTDEKRRILVFGILCHDTGKPDTTVIEPDGRITSSLHASQGEWPTRTFMRDIGFGGDKQKKAEPIVEAVVALVKNHMVHVSGGQLNDGTIRRLSLEVDLRDLGAVVSVDHRSRPPKEGAMPQEMERIMNRADELKVLDSKPKPILKGQHLIDSFGWKEGKHFKDILNAAFEVQLEGAFEDEIGAIIWAGTKIMDGEFKQP